MAMPVIHRCRGRRQRPRSARARGLSPDALSERASHAQRPFSGVSPALAHPCRFCGRPAIDDPITPGPHFGAVHRACFIAWDREQEALELEFAGGFLVPDPVAFAAELVVEADTAPARAA